MISSPRTGKPVLIMDVKVSKGKNISRYGLIERTSSMLDAIESKTVQKDEAGDWQRKKK